MNPAQFQRLRQLWIDDLVDCLVVLVCDNHLSVVELLCQVETINWKTELAEHVGKVSFRCLVQRILLLLLQHDVWFWFAEVGHLVPKQRDTSSDLYKRCNLGLEVHEVIIDVANLLYFDEVGDVAVLIDTSLHVSCACISPRSSGYKHKGAVLGICLEIACSDISIDNRHHPLFLDEDLVEVLY